MVRAVSQGNFDVDHREAGDKAFFQGFADAFFNSRNVLSRYGAAKNLIDEFERFARRKGFDIEEYVAELTVTTALFLMFAFGRGFFLNRFPIGCTILPVSL